MANINRREFIMTSAAAALAPSGFAAENSPFIWGALLHLGCNMWDDFENDPDGWARSAAEEKKRPNPFGPSGKRRSRYHSYLFCEDDVWRRTSDAAHAAGCNMLLVDVGGLGQGRRRHEGRRAHAQRIGAVRRRQTSLFLIQYTYSPFHPIVIDAATKYINSDD